MMESWAGPGNGGRREREGVACTDLRCEHQDGFAMSPDPSPLGWGLGMRPDQLFAHCLHPLFPSVIHRLVTMTSKYATLEASHDATLRQARAANAELQRRIDQEPPGGEGEKKKVRRVEWRMSGQSSD